MSEDIREKLAQERDTTDFRALVAHAQRDALFLVEGGLSLVDVGHAIALDRAPIVKHWTESGLLRRPSTEEREAFGAHPERFRFEVLIVQPYVLARRLADALEA